MAIEFNCPHCATPYRLKDELAGKKAACKNPDCRQVLTIPAAKATVPPTAAPPPAAKPPAPKPAAPKPAARKDETPAPKPPPPKPEDVEAAALAHLADAPAEEAAKDTPIPVVCAFCDHTWTEPRDKAGKNVLCPNPECRQRNKVPVPKDDKPKDWRATAQGPSLAKENFEKPKDVMDAGGVTVVGKEAWTKGGGADADLEPVPLKRRLFFALLILTPIVGLVYGVVWFVGRTVEVREDRLVKDALGGLDVNHLPGAEGPLFSAMVQTAAGEYELREPKDREEALKTALERFTKARDELRQAAAKDDPKKGGGAVRFCVGGELALAQLGLGGTDEQVKAGTRYRWVPKATGPRQRVNEKVVDVHTELQRTLQLVLPADVDARIALARRLTRELVKKGQADIAADLPVMLFAGPEQAEARAVVALEVWRADKAHPFPKAAADDLKATLAKGAGDKSPFPASAVVLWKAVGTDKAPTLNVGKFTGGSAKVSENTRSVTVGLAMLDGKPDEAIEATRAPGTVSGQLKAAILIAEWAPDPGQAFDIALAQLATVTGKKTPEPGSLPPPGVLLRLAQLAGAAGKLDQAKQFADAIPDDGLKAWAKADALRLAAPPGTRLDEAAFEAPSDPAKLRAGHGWGRYWVARHNTRISGDRAKETAAVKDWPGGTVQPLGWAGVAVGLRER